MGREPARGGLGLFPTARPTAAHGWHVTADREHVWAVNMGLLR